MGYYDKFNVPAVSGMGDSSFYPDIPMAGYDIAPQDIDQLAISRGGEDISQLDPNVPSNKADISFLLSQMGGRYDDEGYYGLSQGQIEAAKRAGLGALGANMAMGALSGTWQGFGEGNIKGLLAEKQARDAAMQTSSDRNLAADKQKIDFAKDELVMEKGKLDLETAKEEKAAKAEARKAALAQWRATEPDRQKLKDQLPTYERTKVERIEKQIEVLFAAGELDKALQLASTLDDVGPEADKYRRDKELEDAQAKGKAKGVATEAEIAANDARIRKQFADLGGEKSGYSLESTSNGLVIVTPADKTTRQLQQENLREGIESRNSTQALNKLREEKIRLQIDRGTWTGVISESTINKETNDAMNAMKDYNQLVGVFGTGKTPEKDPTESDADFEKRNGRWITAVNILKSTGFMKDEDVGKPLVASMSRSEMRQRVVENIRAWNRSEQENAAAGGYPTPGADPAGSDLDAKRVSVMQTAGWMQKTVPDILKKTGKSSMSFDEFLAELDKQFAERGQPPISTSIKNNPNTYRALSTLYSASAPVRPLQPANMNKAMQ